MAVKVKLFGLLAEKAGISAFEWKHAQSLGELSEQVRKAYPNLNDAVWVHAVNQTIVHALDTPLKEGDEVAMMPPFAGG